MLSSEMATMIVQKNLSYDMAIQTFIEYKDLYIFQVFSPDPEEGEYDPFYSVHKETGKFQEFSLITDGDISEISNLFLEKKGSIP